MSSLLGLGPTKVSITDLTTLLTIIEMDASIDEQHQLSAQTTDHPIEEGLEVTDNVIQMPDQITITGIVTDTPVEFAASFRELPDRSKTAFELLVDAKETASFVLVTTALRNYSEMIITDVSSPVNAQTGDAVQVVVKLKKVVIANSATVEAPASVQDAPTSAVGAKPTPPASAPVDQSALRAGVLALGGS